MILQWLSFPPFPLPYPPSFLTARFFSPIFRVSFTSFPPLFPFPFSEPSPFVNLFPFLFLRCLVVVLFSRAVSFASVLHFIFFHFPAHICPLLYSPRCKYFSTETPEPFSTSSTAIRIFARVSLRVRVIALFPSFLPFFQNSVDDFTVRTFIRRYFLMIFTRFLFSL